MISAHRKKTPSKLPALGESLEGIDPRQGLIGRLMTALPFLRKPAPLEQAYRRVGHRLMAPEPHGIVKDPPADPTDFQDTVPAEPHGGMSSNANQQRKVVE